MTTVLFWGLLLGVITGAVGVDLWANKGKDAPTPTQALRQLAMYVGLALMFGAVVWIYGGGKATSEYLTGYLVEYALSFDNLFVILLIMGAFAIPKAQQRKLLYMGILGAVVLRGAFILGGLSLVHLLWWLLPLFGLFLLYTGFEIVRQNTDDDEDVPALASKILALGISAFMGALIAIEGCDLLFALDSIPAIFGITTDPFVAMAASMMAVLGLRSLYFVVEALRDRFNMLPVAIGFVLVAIGLKAILPHLEEVGHELVSLGNWMSQPSNAVTLLQILLGAAAVAVVLSALLKKRTGSSAQGKAFEPVAGAAELPWHAQLRMVGVMLTKLVVQRVVSAGLWRGAGIALFTLAALFAVAGAHVDIVGQPLVELGAVIPHIPALLGLGVTLTLLLGGILFSDDPSTGRKYYRSATRLRRARKDAA